MALDFKKIHDLEEKLRVINRNAQRFTLKKPMNKIEAMIEANKDLELTSKGHYDIDYNQDLFSIAF
jgi:hypothetical protein